MITSPTNPHVRLLRSLGEAKGRRTSGLFLVEGVRLVEEALAAGLRPAVALYAPELLQGTPGGQELMGRLQALGGVEATPQVVKAAGQTVTPQGVVAAFPIPPPPRHFPDEGLLIILDQVRDPTNLGTILRSAEAGGCAGVIALEGSADLFHPKVVRGGMGVHMRLPLRGEAAWTEVDRLIQGRQVYVAEAHGGIAYDTVNWIAPAALIIGNETSGPSAEARQRGQGVTIPLLGPTESLNTAVAASIIIFEAARQRRWHR